MKIETIKFSKREYEKVLNTVIAKNPQTAA